MDSQLTRLIINRKNQNEAGILHVLRAGDPAFFILKRSSAASDCRQAVILNDEGTTGCVLNTQ